MSSLLDGFNKSLQFDWDDMLNRPNGRCDDETRAEAYRRADSSTVKVSRLELDRLDNPLRAARIFGLSLPLFWL